jgi:hypothetical protein
MKKIITLCSMIFLIIAMPLNAFAESVPKKEKSKGSEPSSYLLKFNDNNKKELIKKEILEKGGNVKKDYKKNKLIKAELSNDLIIKFKGNENIEFIEPDYQMEALEVTEETVPWGINKVNAPMSHSSNITGKGIKVAVFDTGISKHTDLTINGGISFIEGEGYSDENGHGTHVAGIIASMLNDKGIVGVSPNVELYSVKVLDSYGQGSYSSIIDGIEWAIDNNINIINMSFGSSYHSKILEEAINLATSHGILIVASAGNNGKDTENSLVYPAKFDNVISVGAVDENNGRALFSSVGPELDLVAPGVNIYSTLNKENYGDKSGTSMAAPHVVGVAALLWGKNPEIDSDRIKGLLYYSATNLGEVAHYGNGLVNAGYALELYDSYLAKSLNAQEKSKTKLKQRLKNNATKNQKQLEDFVKINGIEESYVVQSPNPYPNNYSNTWRITKAGATSIRVYFDYINTEMGYDLVELSNGDSYTGANNGVWSSWTNGSYVDVTLRTDNSINDKGFKISKIDYVSGSGQIESYSLESPHPYPNNYNNSWTITKSGASKIRVQFSYIETETNYDFVTTSAGDSLHGRYTNLWSNWSNGSSITVSLTSDVSVQYSGFRIDKIEYVMESDDHGNSFSNPTQVYLNSVVAGAINNPGDEDMFKFIPTATGKYRFESIGSTDTYGYLYDFDGNLLSSNDDGRAPNFFIEYNLTKNQVYYIKIKHYYSTLTGGYGFLVTNGDDYGDNFDQSTVINFSSPISGIIDYEGDADFFRFTPTVSANYLVETTGSTDTYGHLYNSSRQELANNDDGVNNNFRINYPLVANQTYYIKVRHFSTYGMGTYSLTVKIPDNQDDHGNTIGTATPVQVNVNVAGNIEIGEDDDYFKFSVNTSGAYQIETFGNTDTLGELYDSNYQLIATNDDGINTNFRMVQGINADQIYYIKVRPYSRAGTGHYTLLISQLSDDHSNTFESASLLNIGIPINAYLNNQYDEDLFKFTPTQTGIYTINTNSSSLGLDIFGELYDENRTSFEYSDDFSDTDLNINMVVHLEAYNTYYLLLTHADGEETETPSGAYSLEVLFTGDDHSNTISLGSNVLLNQTINGSIESEGDIDYFEFIPSESGLYLFVSLGEIDTVGEILDIDGNRIAFNDDSPIDLNFRIKVSLKANTKYFIKVSHYNNYGRGNYQLAIYR